MKDKIRDYGVLLLMGGIIVALDQWTKYLVRTYIPLGESWSPWPWLEPYARIIHWKNTGAAFGMLQNFGDVFMILAIIVAAAIIYYYPRVPREEWALRLAMGLQLGGAVGNLIDRIWRGTVTDFISVGTFAVFNIADASISVGVAVLVLGIWINERRENSRQAALPKSGGDGSAPGESNDPPSPPPDSPSEQPPSHPTLSVQPEPLPEERLSE